MTHLREQSRWEASAGPLRRADEGGARGADQSTCSADDWEATSGSATARFEGGQVFASSIMGCGSAMATGGLFWIDGEGHVRPKHCPLAQRDLGASGASLHTSPSAARAPVRDGIGP